MSKSAEKKIELAIKSLEMVAHAEDFDPTDCTKIEVEQLHYGAVIALKHLKEDSKIKA